jgi:hypothetical protein
MAGALNCRRSRRFKIPDALNSDRLEVRMLPQPVCCKSPLHPAGLTFPLHVRIPPRLEAFLKKLKQSTEQMTQGGLRQNPRHRMPHIGTRTLIANLSGRRAGEFQRRDFQQNTQQNKGWKRPVCFNLWLSDNP